MEKYKTCSICNKEKKLTKATRCHSCALKGNKNGTYNKKVEKIKKSCKRCSKPFETYPSLICVEHCSQSCARKGKSSWSAGIKSWVAGEKHYNYGKKWSEEIKKKMSNNRKGLTAGYKHPQWKGDNVGYTALHEWVSQTLGKPMHCSFCNSTSKKRYHWANLSGNYIRNRHDWIRLCPKCHKSFDKNRKSPDELFIKKKTHYAERKVLTV